MARKYLQFQGNRVFYSNADGDPSGWNESIYLIPPLVGIQAVAKFFGDKPIFQGTISGDVANSLVGIGMFTPPEKNDYYIGESLTKITFSTEAQLILNKFDNGDYIVSNGVNSGIELIKNGSITSELFVSTFNNLLNNKLIIDKTITPPVVTPPVVTPPVVTPPGVTPPVVTPEPPQIIPPVVIPPTITISAEVQAILTKFDNNDYTYPSWYNKNITWVKDGTLTNEQFLNAFNNLIQTGVII